MKVIYKKTIHHKISDEIALAAINDKRIEKILLTQEEIKEMFLKVKDRRLTTLQVQSLEELIEEIRVEDKKIFGITLGILQETHSESNL